jgi:hypothetical protein
MMAVQRRLAQMVPEIMKKRQSPKVVSGDAN